ncbi:MAG: DUF1501 domain-containing protein [Opitutaceae bacterium]|nr:DUF1501 domain-containing protein [Opitutaceae bacterium]
MNPPEPDPHAACPGVSRRLEDVFLTRREFLGRAGFGLGALGFAALEAKGSATLPTVRAGDAGRLGRARALIHIFAQGAPSQVDTWDPKPMLRARNGEALPGGGVALGSAFGFTRMGRTGLEVSEAFCRTGALADDLAVVRSMWTDIPAHEVATVFMNTGSARPGKPSLGSWLLYGLGSENENLPGFIVLRGPRPPLGGVSNYSGAFLPGAFQGMSVNADEERADHIIRNITRGSGSAGEQRAQLDLVASLNRMFATRLNDQQAVEARIRNYETAFRMQVEGLDAFDLSKEKEATLSRYGRTVEGRKLLTARRLVERGVRVVQVWHSGWDHHRDIEGGIRKSAGEIDQPLAALISDLKERGLLDSTLVLWGGEFGRSPTTDRSDAATPGRDHNAKAFSVVLAGGGVRGGTVIGETDELGREAVRDRCHVHDLHATLLHLMGLDHTRLLHRHNGRDYRLTDVAGNVMKGLL